MVLQINNLQVILGIMKKTLNTENMFLSLIMLSYSKSVLAMDSKSLDNNYMSCTICNQYVTTNILHNTYSIQTFSATNNKYSKHLLSACNIPSHPKTFLLWSKISLSMNVV